MPAVLASEVPKAALSLIAALSIGAVQFCKELLKLSTCM